MIKKLFVLGAAILIVLIDLLGSSQEWWARGKGFVWFLLIMVTIRLIRSLKLGVYNTILGLRGGFGLTMYRDQANRSYWVLMVAEFGLWLFLVWLALIFGESK